MVKTAFSRDLQLIPFQNIQTLIKLLTSDLTCVIMIIVKREEVRNGLQD